MNGKYSFIANCKNKELVRLIVGIENIHKFTKPHFLKLKMFDYIKKDILQNGILIIEKGVVSKE